MMRRIVMLIALLTALALPAQALAAGGDAGVRQYHHRIPHLQREPGEPTPSQPSSSQPSSSLPFTGEDVLLVVLTGLLLAGGGFTLYRQVRER